MGYGVTPYAVKISDITTCVYGSNNKKIKHRSHNLGQIKESFRRSGSIHPDKALEEIIAGNVSRTDGKSGSVYRYVLEVIIRYGIARPDAEQKEIAKQMSQVWDAGDRDTYEKLRRSMWIDLGNRLYNNEFYPIGFDDIRSLLMYPDIPLPFPQQEDFPFTSVISNEEIQKLIGDFSSLNLPESCHEQFRSWLKHCLENDKDLLLYYY